MCVVFVFCGVCGGVGGLAWCVGLDEVFECVVWIECVVWTDEWIECVVWTDEWIECVVWMEDVIESDV